MSLLHGMVVGVVLSVLGFSSAQAALIDNGGWTTDDVSGLDWLDFSATLDTAYSDAESLNPGWRYATNDEVENLLLVSFDGYYDTHASGYSVSNGYDLAYGDQDVDVDNFMSLFGSYIVAGTYVYSWGVYSDESDIIRRAGARSWLGLDTNIVYGADYSPAFGVGTHHQTQGVYLVRGVSVPEPASIALMGLGLVGLGFVRRKKTT